MQNLYWKASGSKTRSLIERPFESQSSFQEYLFNNQDLLEDVFVIHRQVSGGPCEGIPDMVGVDQDGRVCLIALQDRAVSTEMLPKALGYGLWVETNPDTVRSFWLECEDKPECVQADLSDMEIRIVVVAPDFGPDVLRLAPKVGYPIEWVRVRRFAFEENDFLLVERIEEGDKAGQGTTNGLVVYEREFYESAHGKEAADRFFKGVSAIEEVVKNQGWDLEKTLSRRRAAFRHGGRACFGVGWTNNHSCNTYAKVPKAFAETIKVQGWEDKGYSDHWNQQYYRSPAPDDPDVEALVPVLEAAYMNVSGS